MSWIPTDDDKNGDNGAPQDDEELGNAPTMLYMKPVSEDETAGKAAEKAADDVGGETLMMMPAVPGQRPAPDDEGGAPVQGPMAGPLPEGEGLEELDSAKTMMYMPAVGTPGGPDAPPEGDFADEVQKKLAALREEIGEVGGEGEGDAETGTMAYMPAVGGLPVDQAMDKMLAETDEAPRVPTEPAFSAVKDPVKDLGEAATAAAPPAAPGLKAPPVAPPAPAFKPGPDLDDDEDLSDFVGKRKPGKFILILFILILLGAGGVFAAMLFDWMARPEFLESLPHYELTF